MKHQSPEKSLARFWKSALPQFWLTLADAAPDERHRNLYLNQILKAPLIITPLTALHPGERGVDMFCPTCLEKYSNVSESKPAWCANGHAAVQVRLAKDIVAVDDVVKRWAMRKQMGR